MSPVPDPYRVLGVRRDATLIEIKAAHRRLAKAHHPDAGGDAARFLAIQAAYQLLADPLQRRRWDATHAPGPLAAGGRRRARAAGTAADRTADESGSPRSAPHGEPTMDVFVRSSGAAWSAASRAYFRRVAADIPRGARLGQSSWTGRVDWVPSPEEVAGAAASPAPARATRAAGSSGAPGSRGSPATAAGSSVRRFVERLTRALLR